MTHPIIQSAPERAPFLLVGEAPGQPIQRRLWLLPDDSGIPHSANRLRDHLGLTTAEYEAAFDRTNLLVDPQPRKRGGRAFDSSAARTAAVDLYEAAVSRYQGVLVLGRRASRAFYWGLEGGGRRLAHAQVPELCWLSAVPAGFVGPAWTGLRAAVVPHPSGIHRWWNDPENAGRARQFIRDAVAVAGTPGTERSE